MRIAVISDTHDSLPDNLESKIVDIDLILHAGDIGRSGILERLNRIAPTKAVYGNADNLLLVSSLPGQLTLKIEGLIILVLHNIGNLNSFLWKIERGDIQPRPNIVIYGHTHKPDIREVKNIYFVNPGSAGYSRMGISATCVLLIIEQGKVSEHQLIHF